MKPNMRDLILNIHHIAAPWLLSASLFASALAGCDDPKQDDFQDEKGISGIPEGIMRGSVVYLGPRPKCEYVDKKPTRVIGRVILTLFEYTNPPPPQGRATSASNLLTIPGEQMFGLDDCLKDNEEPDPAEKITRSVPFDWPTIALGKEKEIDYQVRGFYDSDEDMVPFFSVKRLPTAGDVVGAAVNDVTDPSKGLAKITFPAREDALDGFVRSGVTVALGNYVWTELPAFQLNPSNRALDAESFIDVAINLMALAPDGPETVNRIWNLTCGAGPFTPGCGLSLQSLKESAVGNTFAEAGIQLDFDPKRYAFFVEPVDLRTIVMGGPDVIVPDGMPDPHPLLGSSLGVAWQTPIVLFVRSAPTKAQADVEKAAGIPGVTLVGSVLPDEVETQRTFVDNMNIAVPPLAVVDLNPANAACRVPYAAPGNLTNTFEDRIAQCSDLPTGIFGINVLHGVAGGAAIEELDPAVSPVGFRVVGGGLSGQAWSIPNELADPVQVGKNYTLKSQGSEGVFIVHDPAPNQTGTCKTARDPRMMVDREIVYRGICGKDETPIVENAVGVDNLACLPSLCCEAVQHLCDVDLCPTYKLNGLNVRTSPTKIVKVNAEGPDVPDCIPFKMPDLCCKGN